MRNASHSVPGGLTQSVEHSSTEPRVGSSNLSGRATLSGNRKQAHKIAGRTARVIPERPDVRRFVARARSLGLTELAARRLFREMDGVAKSIADGTIAPHDGIAAMRARAASLWLQDATSRRVAS